MLTRGVLLAGMAVRHMLRAAESRNKRALRCLLRHSVRAFRFASVRAASLRRDVNSARIAAYRAVSLRNSICALHSCLAPYTLHCNTARNVRAACDGAHRRVALNTRVTHRRAARSHRRRQRHHVINQYARFASRRDIAQRNGSITHLEQACGIIWRALRHQNAGAARDARWRRLIDTRATTSTHRPGSALRYIAERRRSGAARAFYHRASRPAMRGGAASRWRITHLGVARRASRYAGARRGAAAANAGIANARWQRRHLAERAARRCNAAAT